MIESRGVHCVRVVAKDGPFGQGLHHTLLGRSDHLTAWSERPFYYGRSGIETRLRRGILAAALLQHPFIENEADDLLETYAIVQVREHEGPLAAHHLRVFLHYLK